MSCPASAIVAAFRVVAQDADGRVRHADPTDSADAYRIIGVSLNAAVVDAQVQIQQLGLISYAGWAFISGNPVFVDLDGVLTQLPTEAPMYAFALQIGGATGTNRMFINMGPPIFLTA